ncbi:hypothetical protein HYFRA_00012604 [Hymenoscyphus fraxineus]|uniref:GPI anchored serine-rich protein n=1 Tax=Hymenoscyphus fraxineus TaxID=746836 RepID=A0A9N9L3G7_9HELO|nr:hypothetical protein HYFRA_00012604 [Hymenoscyphus fraxineus]
MQFTVAAAAFMASAVMAHDHPGATVYSTMEVTITSCAPTVTNCPARSTVVSTTSFPVVPTPNPYPVPSPSPVPTVPSPAPYVHHNASIPAASPTKNTGTPYNPVSVAEESPAPSEPAVPEKPVGEKPVGPGPQISVVAITSCVPTVIYETITVSPTLKPSAPVPSSTGSINPPKNVTTPLASPTPTAFTGSAAGLQGSAAFAAVAGLVAILFV